MEQIGDSAPFLPSLDVPVPLMGEQLVAVYKLLDVAVPEQVIEGPKIFVDAIPSRRLCRDPQMAEQLVEVPTPSPALVPSPRMEDQLVEVPPIVPQPVPFFVGADGYIWKQIAGLTGVYWWRVGSSHTQWAPHLGTPPGQGGIEILAAATLADVVVVDVPVNMQHKFQQSLVLHWCATISFGTDSAENCGIAAGAAPVVLWTSL